MPEKQKKYASLESLSTFLENIKPSLIPSGAIIIWSGNSDNIPDGWCLCDGTNGTPDLRDKFVLGAGSDYSAGDIGGEKEHILTVNEMPTNIGQFNALSWASHISQTQGGFSIQQNHTDLGKIDGANFGDALYKLSGGGQSHNNMPPYYALCYIMKL